MTNVFQREAQNERATTSRRRSTDSRPAWVLMIIGKTTMMNTTAIFDRMSTPNQMISNGARATIGAAYNADIQTSSALSTVFHCTIAAPTPIPTATPRTKPMISS